MNIAYLDPSVIDQSVARVVRDGEEVARFACVGGVDAIVKMIDDVTRKFAITEWRISTNGFQVLLFGTTLHVRLSDLLPRKSAASLRRWSRENC